MNVPLVKLSIRIREIGASFSRLEKLFLSFKNFIFLWFGEKLFDKPKKIKMRRMYNDILFISLGIPFIEVVLRGDFSGSYLSSQSHNEALLWHEIY